jgi:glucose-6-phosphate 1-dehydrogenase
METENQTLVIFGASGDLTERKLIPAVFNLYLKKYLPAKYAILGVSRTPFSDDEFRRKVVFENEFLLKKNGKDKKLLGDFAKRIHYQAIDTSAQSDYNILKDRLHSLKARNMIFYLSVPPSLYPVIPQNLASAGLNEENDGWRRLIIEKPFGYDLQSAKQLNKSLLRNFKEDQLYRIDHYLGKETVQNLLVWRFSNSIFEPLWNRNYIHRVEITSAESVGVEGRGGYYEGSGALRDMVQNHLLQLVALTAMEPPIKSDAYHIRNEMLKVFEALSPLTKKEIKTNIIRGQYASSKIKGEYIKGYREEKGVDPNSRTETFVALKFNIDNWRWADVPFYIRTGKKLPARVSEIVIHFKPNHHPLFSNNNQKINAQNMLILRIQPDEGILMKFGMKVPGAGFDVKNVNMDFLYSDLANTYVPEAYERLILDCMQGDATLYARGDNVETAWKFVNPILKAWEKDTAIPIYSYPSGTWGPKHADDLIEGKNMAWRYPCENLVEDGEYLQL